MTSYNLKTADDVSKLPDIKEIERQPETADFRKPETFDGSGSVAFTSLKDRNRTAYVDVQPKSITVQYDQDGERKGREEVDRLPIAYEQVALWLLDFTAVCDECGTLYETDPRNPSFVCQGCAQEKLKKMIDQQDSPWDGDFDG